MTTLSERFAAIIRLVDLFKKANNYEAAATHVKTGLKANDVSEGEVVLLFEKLLEVQEVEFRVCLENVVDEFTTSGDFRAATRLIMALFIHHRNKNTDRIFSQLMVLITDRQGDLIALDEAIKPLMKAAANIQIQPRIEAIIADRFIVRGKYDLAMTIIEPGLEQAKQNNDKVLIEKYTRLSQRAKKLKKQDEKTALRLIKEQKESKKKAKEKLEKTKEKQKRENKGKQKQEIKDTKEENEKTGGGEKEQGQDSVEQNESAFVREREEISFHIVREEYCGHDCYVGFTKTNICPVKKAFIRAQDPHINQFQKLVDVCSKHRSLLGVEQAVKVGKENSIYLVTEVVYPVTYYFRLMCQQHCPRSLEEWWEIIEEQFWIIFRDIIHGLMHLFKTGYACGNVSFNTFVTPDGRGRLLPSLASPKPKDDIKELSQLMKTVISFPFEGNDDRTFIPHDLRSFLDLIDDIIKSFKSIPMLPEFLLDHPYFWTIGEKIDFCFKLRKLIKTDTVYVAIEKVLQTLGLFKNWNTVIVEGVYHKVLDKPNKSGYLSKYRTSVDIVRFFYAVYTHINEKEYKDLRGKKKLTDEQIEEALMGYFPNFYSDMFKCLCDCGGKRSISAEHLLKLSSVYSQAAERPIKARRN
ncbi:uncharacterized protein LOC141612088 [Silene latifolia]|uniref:uncharacterized protein LOC141612088 n=1 Tax=Silene latifolia TaxID=37657 RepID=UPI003D7836D8